MQKIILIVFFFQNPNFPPPPIPSVPPVGPVGGPPGPVGYNAPPPGAAPVFTVPGAGPPAAGPGPSMPPPYNQVLLTTKPTQVLRNYTLYGYVTVPSFDYSNNLILTALYTMYLA